MSEPLLNVAPRIDGARGPLVNGGGSSGNQDVVEGEHPFAQVLAGQSEAGANGQAASGGAAVAGTGGKVQPRALPADGKDLPVDLAEWLERTGLPLEGQATDPEGGDAGGADSSPLVSGEYGRDSATTDDPDTGAVAVAAVTDTAVDTGPEATGTAPGAEAGEAAASPAAAQVAATVAARNGETAEADAVPGERSARPAHPAHPVIAARAAATDAGDPDATQPVPVGQADSARTLTTAIHQALQQGKQDGDREVSVGDLVRSVARAGTPAADAPRGDGATASGVSAPATSAPNQQTQAALPTTTVQVPVRQQGWDQAVGEQVQWMVGQKLQSAEIKLNPAHLGPMEVRIQVQNDQASIHFTAQHGMVRDALEAAVPRLREMLGESGLNLNNVNVSDHSFAEQQRRDAQEPSRTHYGYAGEDGAGVEELSTTLVTPLRSGAGSIDYFA